MIQKKTAQRLYDPVDKDYTKDFDYSEFHPSTTAIITNSNFSAEVDNTCMIDTF